MIDNKYYVIDAHCHVYPTEIAVKATEATCRFYGMAHFADGSVDSLLEKGIRRGIDMSIIESVATSGAQVRHINEFIASVVARHPAHLLGLGTLHVDAPDLEGEVRHLISLGLRGVKLHPDIQKVAVNDPRCMAIFELCRDYGLPVLLHTGDVRYAYSNPPQVVPVAKSFPTLPMIAAHLGGWSMQSEAYKSYVNLPNVFTDCSSALAYLSPEQAAEIIRAYGTSRVLFGSDFPLWDPVGETQRVLALGLSEAENAAVFSGNARHLFRIST